MYARQGKRNATDVFRAEVDFEQVLYRGSPDRLRHRQVRRVRRSVLNRRMGFDRFSGPCHHDGKGRARQVFRRRDEKALAVATQFRATNEGTMRSNNDC